MQTEKEIPLFSCLQSCIILSPPLRGAWAGFLDVKSGAFLVPSLIEVERPQGKFLRLQWNEMQSGQKAPVRRKNPAHAPQVIPDIVESSRVTWATL